MHARNVSMFSTAKGDVDLYYMLCSNMLIYNVTT